MEEREGGRGERGSEERGESVGIGAMAETEEVRIEEEREGVVGFGVGLGVGPDEEVVEEEGGE